MTTHQHLQRTLDYIEAHLGCDLTLDELSSIAGFSKYHFSSCFTALVGLSVHAYITRRRLEHILYQHQEGQSLIDACLAYGFDTHAGFYKAFKRWQGCSPRKYLRLYTVKAPTPYNLLKESRFMLTQTQLKSLLKSWPITLQDDPTNATNVGGLVTSATVWMIDTRYVLKTTQDLAGLKKHIAMSRAIEAAGFNAATPIPTTAGEDFLLQDDRAFMLMKQVPGQFLKPEERYGEYSLNYAQSYGIAIAELHEVLRDKALTLELAPQHQYDVVMSWAMPEAKRVLEQYGYTLPEAFYSDYTEGFKALYNALPVQPIHRDANPSNILFESGDVSGFIDFDISVESARIFDPCYCATGILSEAFLLTHQFEAWPPIFKAILDGYNTVLPLTKEERQALPYMVYSIQLIFIAYLANNPSYKDALKTNMEMLLWLFENRDLWIFN